MAHAANCCDGDTAVVRDRSGAATGWTMTDWIEDVLSALLRVDYDCLGCGELKFDSPQVNLALDYNDEDLVQQ